MTDDLGETPNLARRYCPACSPDADPLREILETDWCHDHKAPLDGEDDLHVPSELIREDFRLGLDGGAEHRAICNAIHRPSS